MSDEKKKTIMAGKSNGPKPLHNWPAVRQYFVKESLRRKKRVPLKEVAANFEISYGLVKQRAAAENWTLALKTSQERVAAKVEEEAATVEVLNELDAL
jgi:hypothetical protein